MIHTRSNERGVALLAVLLFGIAAMSYAFSVLQSSVAAQEQSRAARAAVRAYQAAEAGVHRVVARLNQRNEPLRWGGELTQTLQGTGENAISFVARVELAASDNADNDRDGLVDEDDESYLRELVCTGQADGIRRTIRVTLFSEQQTHTVGSAVYLGDTGADVTFEGNAFRIAGEDHDMDRNPIGSDSVVGLGVGGIATGIGSQVKPKRADQITGTGGSPSVAQVLPPDLTGFLSDALRIANVRFDGGSVNPKDGDWGTLEAPAIVYSRGSLEVAGGAAGVGLLVVDGSLTISGSFHWNGLVVVNGPVVMTGGGSSKLINGGLVIGAERELGMIRAPGVEDSLYMDGTADVAYSRAALDFMEQSFVPFTVLNWRDAANPGEGE